MGGKMEETRTRFCDAIPAAEGVRRFCASHTLGEKELLRDHVFPNFYVPSVT